MREVDTTRGVGDALRGLGITLSRRDLRESPVLRGESEAELLEDIA